MKKWFYYKEAYEKINKPMAQQTAVDWLVNELESEAITDYSFAQAHKLITLDVYTFNKLFEQANKMFEEQIIEAYIEGEQILSESDFKAQHYYNETYGK